MLVAGVDGCRSGWLIALRDTEDPDAPPHVQVVEHFAEVLALPVERIVIDIPIGLPETATPGGRACDREARRLLGTTRGSSVLSAPPRRALALRSFDDPERPASGLTRQVWAILPKIREVDAALDPGLHSPETGGRPVVLESHPEVVFADLNGGYPVSSAKRAAGGGVARLALLRGAFGGAFAAPRAPRGARAADVLDACACLWVASAPQLDQLVALPAVPAPRDASGLAMQIWRRRPVAVSPETLFEDALDWLWATYGERRHFVERDLVWTLQTRLLAQIREFGLPWQVRNDYAALHGPRRAFSADLGDPCRWVARPPRRMQIRAVPPPHRHPPGEASGDRLGRCREGRRTGPAVRRRPPHAARVRGAIDEGGFFRARPALPEGRWVDWGAPDRAPGPRGVRPRGPGRGAVGGSGGRHGSARRNRLSAD